MHEVTQQRLDEADILKANIFINAGITEKAGLVMVALLESQKEGSTQFCISKVTAMPQGVISKSLKELINKGWVISEQKTEKEGKGRPTLIYNPVSIKQIVKDLTHNLTTYIKVTKENIADLEKVYK